MPAKDIFHDAVRNALIKDGWTITHDPYPNGKIYIQHDGTEEGIADRIDHYPLLCLRTSVMLV